MGNTLLFDKDGKHVFFNIYGNPDGDPIQRWNTEARHAQPMFEPGNDFSFDKKRELLAIVKRGSILLRTTTENQLLYRWNEEGSRAVLSPDGKHLATVRGDDPVIRIYDLPSKP